MVPPTSGAGWTSKILKRLSKKRCVNSQNLNSFRCLHNDLCNQPGHEENTTPREDQPSSQVEHDSLSVSTDCDSYTADSNSVCEEERTKDSVCDKDSSDTSCKFENGACRSKECVVDFALRIFKKYIALEAHENVKCPEEIRRGVIENICDSSKILSANCFEEVEKYVCDVMEREYFQVFLGSDYFCKHQIDVLTSGNVVLEDILYNETALFYFMEFLEQENHRALLEFWLAATNFQQQLHEQKESYDPMEAQNDAVVLYDKYFSLQAHCPLGFGDKVRFAVEQNICGENGVIVDCFHLPLKIVEKVLERNYLKPFLASQLFYKYLSELISTVQTYGYSNSFEHDKHSPSECSSERSFSTNSTFLAMENPSKNKKKNRVTNMSIDTRQLYDPDALWKRKKNSRLSFGRITELGRYETDFEPEPDKNNRSRLKNVMRRLVNLEDEEKRKEEMAWQVAEMIVKDITNVTLNQQPFHS